MSFLFGSFPLTANSWNNEEDKETILEGPFDMRVVEADVVEGSLDFMPQPAATWIQNALHQ